MPLRFPRATYTSWVEGVRDLSVLLRSLIQDDAAPYRWRSMKVPLSATQGAGVKDPDFAKLRDNGSGSTGVYEPAFDAGVEEEVFFSVELPEDYKEFTNIIPQIHWSPGSSTSTNTVRWGLEYSLANVDAAFPTTTIIYVEDAGSGTAYQHQSADFAAIDGSSLTIEAIMNGRLFRDAGHANDTFPADAFGLELRLKYQCDVARGAQQPDTKWRTT